LDDSEFQRGGGRKFEREGEKEREREREAADWGRKKIWGTLGERQRERERGGDLGGRIVFSFSFLLKKKKKKKKITNH
jgi:hypothetical protein